MIDSKGLVKKFIEVGKRKQITINSTLLKKEEAGQGPSTLRNTLFVFKVLFNYKTPHY